MSISRALKVAGFAAVLWLLGQDKTPIRGVVPAGEGFTLEQVLAPKAAGALLVVLDFVLRRSPLGPPLRRKLLNDNELRIVRELAAQIDMPPLHHPMHRRGPPADAGGRRGPTRRRTARPRCCAARRTIRPVPQPRRGDTVR